MNSKIPSPAAYFYKKLTTKLVVLLTNQKDYEPVYSIVGIWFFCKILFTNDYSLCGIVRSLSFLVPWYLKPYLCQTISITVFLIKKYHTKLVVLLTNQKDYEPVI